MLLVTYLLKASYGYFLVFFLFRNERKNCQNEENRMDLFSIAVFLAYSTNWRSFSSLLFKEISFLWSLVITICIYCLEWIDDFMRSLLANTVCLKSNILSKTLQKYHCSFLLQIPFRQICLYNHVILFWLSDH